MKTKVVHIGCGHRYNDTRILRRECRTLQNAGYDVVYATSREWFEEDKKTDTIFDGVTVKAGPWKRGGVSITRDVCTYLSCRKNNKKELIRFIVNEKPDILHVHEIELMYVVPKIRKKIPDIKIIFDVHEDFPGSYYDLFMEHTNRIIATIASVYTRHILKKYLVVSDAVITVTPNIQRQLEELGTLKANLVRNFPIISRISGDQNIEPWVCYCGTIDEGRNIRMMLECAKGFEGQLHLAGRCWGECEELVGEYEKKLPDKIVYHGMLSHEETLELCSNSTVGLCIFKGITNNTTAYPTKLFEYMMQQIPVVCSDFPTWREIVADNECGILVDPEDEENIVRSVNSILKDKELAKRMGRNGRKAVEEKYNWSTEAKHLLEVYQAINEE